MEEHVYIPSTSADQIKELRRVWDLPDARGEQGSNVTWSDCWNYNAKLKKWADGSEDFGLAGEGACI